MNMRFDKRIYSKQSILAGFRAFRDLCSFDYYEDELYITSILIGCQYDAGIVEKELANYILDYEVHSGGTHEMD